MVLRKSVLYSVSGISENLLILFSPSLYAIVMVASWLSPTLSATPMTFYPIQIPTEPASLVGCNFGPGIVIIRRGLAHNTERCM